MEPRLASLLADVGRRRGRVVVLTGAGISAESGIPTFRGAEGYWVVGSRNYVPQEMATHAMFEEHPEEVWRWHLYRFGVVRGAEPNAGSHRVLAIHGEAEWVRCAAGCGAGLSPLPDLGSRAWDGDGPPPGDRPGDRRGMSAR